LKVLFVERKAETTKYGEVKESIHYKIEVRRNDRIGTPLKYVKARFRDEVKETKKLTVPKDKRVQQGLTWDLSEP
jgi:hypothetical protein